MQYSLENPRRLLARWSTLFREAEIVTTGKTTANSRFLPKVSAAGICPCTTSLLGHLPFNSTNPLYCVPKHTLKRNSKNYTARRAGKQTTTTDLHFVFIPYTVSCTGFFDLAEF